MHLVIINLLFSCEKKTVYYASGRGGGREDKEAIEKANIKSIGSQRYNAS